MGSIKPALGTLTKKEKFKVPFFQLLILYFLDRDEYNKCVNRIDSINKLRSEEKARKPDIRPKPQRHAPIWNGEEWV